MSTTHFTQTMNKAVAALLGEQRSALIDQLSGLGYLNVPANTALAAVDGTSTTVVKARKLKGKRRVKVKASVAATSDDESQPDLIAQMVVNSGFQTSSFEEETKAPKVSKKAAKTAATRATLIAQLSELNSNCEVLATSTNADIRKMISEARKAEREAEKKAKQAVAEAKRLQAKEAKALAAAEKAAQRKLAAESKKAQAGTFTGVYPILNAKGEYLRGNKPNPTTGNPPLLRVKQNKETKELVMVAPGNWTPTAKRLFTQFQKNEDPSLIWKKRNSKKPAKKTVKKVVKKVIKKVVKTVTAPVQVPVVPVPQIEVAVQEVKTVEPAVQEVKTVEPAVQEVKVAELVVPEVDSSDEDEPEEKANTVLFQTDEAEEAVNEIISNFSGEQLPIPTAQLQEEEYDDEEEGECELGDEHLWTHQGQNYFKRSYAGTDHMVFNQVG